jgi:hypothetical protein
MVMVPGVLWTSRLWDGLGDVSGLVGSAVWRRCWNQATSWPASAQDVPVLRLKDTVTYISAPVSHFKVLAVPGRGTFALVLGLISGRSSRPEARRVVLHRY